MEAEGVPLWWMREILMRVGFTAKEAQDLPMDDIVELYLQALKEFPGVELKREW